MHLSEVLFFILFSLMNENENYLPGNDINDITDN